MESSRIFAENYATPQRDARQRGNTAGKAEYEIAMTVPDRRMTGKGYSPAIPRGIAADRPCDNDHSPLQTPQHHSIISGC